MPVYTAVSITTPVPDRKIIGAGLEEEIEDEVKFISKIKPSSAGFRTAFEKQKKKRIFSRTNSSFLIED